MINQLLKKISIIVLIIITSLGCYYLGTEKETKINIVGTYLFDNKETLDVKNDTYLTLNVIEDEYVYYKDVESKGKIEKIHDNLYVLRNGQLNNYLVSVFEEKIILIDNSYKYQEIYKFDNTLLIQ